MRALVARLVPVLALLGAGCAAPAVADAVPSADPCGCAGAFASAGDGERFRLELHRDGVFRLFVREGGRSACAVWGTWVVVGGALGGVDVALLPGVPGVRVHSPWTLRLRATPETRPTRMDFDWASFDPGWASFAPGRRTRFDRVAWW